MLLATEEGRKKARVYGYLEFCEMNKYEPIPFWEDTQFAAESTLVKVVDEKTGLTIFEKGWGE
jgi:hypothetical protein